MLSKFSESFLFLRVKLAIDLKDNSSCAIKILKKTDNSQKIAHFIEEVNHFYSLSHKNIIRLKFVNLNGIYQKNNGEVSNLIYYVMQIALYGELY